MTDLTVITCQECSTGMEIDNETVRLVEANGGGVIECPKCGKDTEVVL